VTAEIQSHLKNCIQVAVIKLKRICLSNLDLTGTVLAIKLHFKFLQLLRVFESKQLKASKKA
jgi:hypothetical protein